MPLASFPSPPRGVWHVGPVPIRAYALCIILAIIVAVFIGERRWRARGGRSGTISDIAAWVVPFGLVGGRLYHVITSPSPYFGRGGDPVKALYVWEGGLGIPGAILLGGIGAWIACRRRGISTAAFGDAVAPAIAVGQAIGRWGNYFNQELFGKPTDLPWGLEIDEAHRGSYIQYSTFHPTFLYEFVWDVVGVIVLLLVDRIFRIRRPALFALYVSWYTFGRFFEELLRIDPAHEYFGLRLNAYVSIVCFVLSTAFFIWWQFLRRPTPADRPRASRVVPSGPAMAVPKGRVR